MRVYENIYRFPIPVGGTIRVWCSATPLAKLSADEIEHQRTQLGRVLAGVDWTRDSIRDLVDMIGRFPFCNAVELTDTQEHGFLLYPDWP